MNPAEVATLLRPRRRAAPRLQLPLPALRPGPPSASAREIERMERRRCPARAGPTSCSRTTTCPRHATPLRPPGARRRARARVAALMLLTLRGTPFLYYGEEIGMRNVPVPPERLQDPLARHAAPEPVARPRAHADAVGAGPRRRLHARASPGSRSAPTPDARNVAAPARRPALAAPPLPRAPRAAPRAPGAPRRLLPRASSAPKGVLAFERRAGDERALVALNFGDEPRELRFADAAGAPRALDGSRARAPARARAASRSAPARGCCCSSRERPEAAPAACARTSASSTRSATASGSTPCRRCWCPSSATGAASRSAASCC